MNELTTALPPLPENALAPTTENSGNWAAGDTTSEGLVLKIGQTKGMGIYFTYEMGFKSPRHYTFLFKLTDHGSFPIFTTELVDGKVAERVVGKAQLYFTTETEGVFVFDMEGFDVQGFPIHRLGKSTNDARSGPWVEDEASKAGYMIGFFPSALTTVHWFGNRPYDEPWPGTYPKGQNHTQDWQIGLAKHVRDEEYSVLFQRVVNSEWGNIQPVKYEPVRTCVMRLTAEGIEMIGPGKTELLQQIAIQ
jgi:hypothetical protein